MRLSFPEGRNIMWWWVGGVIYLLLLALGLLFVHGASRLSDPDPLARDYIEEGKGENNSGRIPRQLWLPFTSPGPPALSYARASLVAAVLHKLSTALFHQPGA